MSSNDLRKILENAHPCRKRCDDEEDENGEDY